MKIEPKIIILKIRGCDEIAPDVSRFKKVKVMKERKKRKKTMREIFIVIEKK